MPAVYPEAPQAPREVPPFDEAKCVDEIVALRAVETNIGKVRAGGRLIHKAGGTTADINRVWDAIETERKALAAISPADHTTASKYTTALGAVATRLDPDTWYEALKVSKGVTTWADLKAAFTVTTQEI